MVSLLIEQKTGANFRGLGTYTGAGVDQFCLLLPSFDDQAGIQLTSSVEPTLLAVRFDPGWEDCSNCLFSLFNIVYLNSLILLKYIGNYKYALWVTNKISLGNV